MTSMGVNYSSNGGFSYNAFGAQFDAYGNYQGFDPSIGYSMSFYYNSKEQRNYIYDSQNRYLGDGSSVEYSDKSVNEFAERNLEPQEGLLGVKADGTVPKGDTYDAKNGVIITSSGDRANGVTVMPKGWSTNRGSMVYIAKDVCRTTELLYITLQHEYGHVILNYLGYTNSAHFSSKNYDAFQETIMNKLSSMQAAAWGMNEYRDFYKSESNSYSKSVNFNSNLYFDYSGSIKHNRPW